MITLEIQKARVEALAREIFIRHLTASCGDHEAFGSNLTQGGSLSENDLCLAADRCFEAAEAFFAEADAWAHNESESVNR